MLVIPNLGQRRILELIVAQNLSLRIYVNDHEPTRTDSLADFVEPRGRTGYKPRDLDSALWTVVEGDEGLPSYAAYGKEVFQFESPPMELDGYFVQTQDELLWAERFLDGPYVVEIAADR